MLDIIFAVLYTYVTFTIYASAAIYIGFMTFLAIDVVMHRKTPEHLFINNL